MSNMLKRKTHGFAGGERSKKTDGVQAVSATSSGKWGAY